MLTRTERNVALFRSWVNPIISLMFVGSFTFAACLLIWNVAFGENPVANAMAAAMVHRTTLEGN
jgi:hypothetical protein